MSRKVSGLRSFKGRFSQRAQYIRPKSIYVLLMMLKDVVGEVAESGSQPYEHFAAKSPIPLQPRDAPKHATSTMEEDRTATNLGPEVDEGITEEPVAVPKQPKRRFVGRKTAEKNIF